MREIIYIQAGSFANYIGTHFWNAQEQYFIYPEQEEVSAEPLIDNDVSFREGVDRKVLFAEANLTEPEIGTYLLCLWPGK